MRKKAIKSSSTSSKKRTANMGSGASSVQPAIPGINLPAFKLNDLFVYFSDLQRNTGQKDWVAQRHALYKAASGTFKTGITAISVMSNKNEGGRRYGGNQLIQAIELLKTLAQSEQAKEMAAIRSYVDHKRQIMHEMDRMGIQFPGIKMDKLTITNGLGTYTSNYGDITSQEFYKFYVQEIQWLARINAINKDALKKLIDARNRLESIQYRETKGKERRQLWEYTRDTAEMAVSREYLEPFLNNLLQTNKQKGYKGDQTIDASFQTIVQEAVMKVMTSSQVVSNLVARFLTTSNGFNGSSQQDFVALASALLGDIVKQVEMHLLQSLGRNGQRTGMNYFTDIHGVEGREAVFDLVEEYIKKIDKGAAYDDFDSSFQRALSYSASDYDTIRAQGVQQLQEDLASWASAIGIETPALQKTLKEILVQDKVKLRKEETIRRKTDKLVEQMRDDLYSIMISEKGFKSFSSRQMRAAIQRWGKSIKFKFNPNNARQGSINEAMQQILVGGIRRAGLIGTDRTYVVGEFNIEFLNPIESLSDPKQSTSKLYKALQDYGRELAKIRDDASGRENLTQRYNDAKKQLDQAINLIQKFLQEHNEQVFIVHSSDKLSVNAETGGVIGQKGFQGTEFTGFRALDQLNAGLNHLDVSAPGATINIDIIKFLLLNMSSNALGGGNEDAIKDRLIQYLSAFGAILMFDDIDQMVIDQTKTAKAVTNSLSTMSGGLYAIHIFTINGVQLPLSLILFQLAKQYENLIAGAKNGFGNDPTDTVKVKISSGVGGVVSAWVSKAQQGRMTNTSYYDPDDWANVANAATSSIKLNIIFLQNFTKLIKNLTDQIQ